jgi:hypothetical protein
MKVIDLSKTTKELVTKNFKTNDNVIIEKSKSIRKISQIFDIINSSDSQKTNSFFGKANWTNDYTSLISMNFEFNPYKTVKDMAEIDAFFDYYHSYSKDFLFVPNIKLDVRKRRIISLEDYIKYIDETYRILNNRNGKPLFIPVSLKLSLPELDILLNHCIENEYFYFWFDFEGKPIEPETNAKTRRFLNKLRDSGYFDNTLSYYTNIKREVLSNKKNNSSPGSDIQASVAGANFIGVNREPIKFIKKEDETSTAASREKEAKDLLALQRHKARRFSQETYYYIKPKGKLDSTTQNVTGNSIRLSNEFLGQAEYFIKHRKIEPYLKTKKMFTDHPEMLSSLTDKIKITCMQDFL